MKNTILTTTLAMAILATPAFAGDDSEAYIGGGIGSVEDLGGVLFLRGGYNFSKYFGVEGDFGFGIIDEDVEGTNIVVAVDDVTLKVKSSFAGYGIARWPVSENFDIFGRVGYHALKVEAEAKSQGVHVSGTSKTDGLAYGGGVEYKFDEANAMRGDITVYDGDDDDSLTSFSVSYIRRF